MVVGKTPVRFFDAEFPAFFVSDCFRFGVVLALIETTLYEFMILYHRIYNMIFKIMQLDQLWYLKLYILCYIVLKTSIMRVFYRSMLLELFYEPISSHRPQMGTH